MTHAKPISGRPRSQQTVSHQQNILVNWISADGCNRRGEFTDMGSGVIIESLEPWDREPEQPMQHVLVHGANGTLLIRGSDWSALERTGNDYSVYRLALEGRLSEERVRCLSRGEFEGDLLDHREM